MRLIIDHDTRDKFIGTDWLYAFLLGLYLKYTWHYVIMFKMKQVCKATALETVSLHIVYEILYPLLYSGSMKLTFVRGNFNVFKIGLHEIMEEGITDCVFVNTHRTHLLYNNDDNDRWIVCPQRIHQSGLTKGALSKYWGGWLKMKYVCNFKSDIIWHAIKQKWLVFEWVLSASDVRNV